MLTVHTLYKAAVGGHNKPPTPPYTFNFPVMVFRFKFTPFRMARSLPGERPEVRQADVTGFDFEAVANDETHDFFSFFWLKTSQP